MGLKSQEPVVLCLVLAAFEGKGLRNPTKQPHSLTLGGTSSKASFLYQINLVLPTPALTYSKGGGQKP